MFDTFREPNLFTFSVIFAHIASFFTFSVDIFSHLATFLHIAAFSHLRVPHTYIAISHMIKVLWPIWRFMPSDKSLIYKPKRSWGFVNETFVWGLKTSYCAITLYYQIVSLFEMIIDMGDRRAGKQNRPSLIFEAPPPHTPNSQKYLKHNILTHLWKTGC